MPWGGEKPAGLSLSLYAKLTLVFGLLLAALVAGCLAVWLWGLPLTPYGGDLEHEKSEAMRSLNVMADLKKERLRNWLDERDHDFLFLANNQYFAQGVARLRRHEAQLRASGTTPKDLWARVAAWPEYETLRQFLLQFMQAEGRYLSLAVMDVPGGRVILAADPRQLGLGLEEENFFRGALRSRGGYVSDVRLAADGTTSVMDLSRVILDQGEPAAVVFAHVNAEAILKPLLGAPEGGIEFGEAVLVNSRAVTLTSLKHPLPDGSRVQPLSHVMTATPARLAAAGEEGSIETLDYRGRRVLAAYRHVRLSSSLGWGLVIKRDVDDVLVSIRQSMIQTVLIWAAGLVLALFITLLLARALVRPLTQLTEASHRVASGDLTARAPVRSRDEVGRLALVFNDMVERLRQLTQGLEERVAARTAQLVEANHRLQEEMTQRLAAQEARIKSEQDFRRIVDTANEGICVVDASLRITFVNQRMARMLGRQPEEMMGRAMEDLIFPEDRAAFRRDAEERKQGRSQSFERRYLRKDSSVIWALVNAAPILDPQGGLQGSFAMFTDITQRKLDEQALAEEKELLAVTLRSIGDGVITTDTQGRVVQLNHVAEELTGWPQGEAEGIHIGEVFRIINEQSRRPCENPVEKVLELGIVVGLANHTLLVARDGTTRAIADSGAPIRAIDGRILGVVLVFRDVTQRMQIESELRQAQKMEAIGTLAGGIAHDFNNILAAVLGFAEMALDDAKSGQVNPADLEQILFSAQRAKSLVQQILAFSRKNDPTLKPLDLNQIVLRAGQVLERTLPKMIDIETCLAPDLPHILADPTQMEQVLFNLATNAADAMPEGGKLVIETRALSLDQEYCAQHLEIRPGDYAVLGVTDTGGGMDTQTQQQIFDPFFTTKDVGKGTGLGLSTVYGIVKNHGGHIHCYSELGLGATFKVYLPLMRTEPEREAPMESVADLQALGGEETVLLVDDEERLLKFASRTLEGRGYRVITAASGEEALETYHSQGRLVDLVVMDLGMPGMGGHKALKEILAVNPGAKVVIASGYAAGEQVKTSLEAGAAGYVAKPFKQAELLSVVRRALDGQ